jgi:hypothetical protein
MKINVMIIALALFLNHSGLSQSMIVSAGTSFTGNGGNIVLRGDVLNDGSFINNNNKVIFAGAAQSLGGTSPTLFNNLAVASGSTTAIITAGQTLKGILVSNGTLNAGGNITLLSTALQTALIDGSGTGQVLGNVTMQRYLPSGFGYKYFSSPFQGATVNEFGDDMDLLASFTSFYKYDESRVSSGWINYKDPAGVLNPMNGYAVNFGSSAAANTVDVTGIVNNGILSLTLYNHNNIYTKGFNLVGNPYPSPIDWDASSGWTRTKIDDAVYYFIASSTDQYGGVYSTYMNGLSSDGLATNIIPSMQGFFIHVSDGIWPVTGSLELNNNARVNDMTHPFLKSAVKGTKSLIRLVAGYSSDSISYDPLVIYYDEKATFDFDGQLDALKLYNTDASVTNFYVFGNDESRLSIDAIPLPDENVCTLRLGLKTEQSGEVTFKIRDCENIFLDKRITLTDLVAGTNRELTLGDQHRVYLAAGDYQNRFFLNVSNDLTDIPDYTSDKYLFKVYSTHEILKAEIILPPAESGILTVCSITGQVLYNREIYVSGYYEFNPSVIAGLYLVTFSSRNKRISKMLFIQSR